MTHSMARVRNGGTKVLEPSTLVSSIRVKSKAEADSSGLMEATMKVNLSMDNSRVMESITSLMWTSFTRENSALGQLKAAVWKPGTTAAGTRATSRTARRTERAPLPGPTAPCTLAAGQTIVNME